MVEYRVVEGYEWYRVGNDGSFWSKAPYGRSKVPQADWSRMKGSTNRSGHILVCLGGTKNRFYLHVLVARAFLGPQPDGLIVRHLDDDPSNNNVSNLSYGTYKDNHEDSVRNGTATMLPGQDSPFAILDNAKVLEIVELVKSGQSKSSVAIQFNVHNTTISAIMTGQSWSETTGFVYDPKPNGRKGQARTKLSDKDIIEIFKLRNQGVALKEIAEIFGISPNTVKHTLAGRGRQLPEGVPDLLPASELKSKAKRQTRNVKPKTKVVIDFDIDFKFQKKIQTPDANVVAEILKAKNELITSLQAGDRFGVTTQTIRKIWNGTYMQPRT